MKIIKHVFWLIPFVLIIVFSCKKEVFDTTPDTIDPACDTITYVKHIQAIFVQKCISCHIAGGTGPGDYTKLENIKNQKDRIKVRAVIEGTMPESGPMTKQERELLGKWIDCGTKGI